LEAVLADVMLNGLWPVGCGCGLWLWLWPVGSVYVAPGDIKALDIFDTVISNILSKHSRVLIATDANFRSSLWDDSCFGISSHTFKSSNGFEIRGHYLKTWSSGT